MRSRVNRKKPEEDAAAFHRVSRVKMCDASERYEAMLHQHVNDTSDFNVTDELGEARGLGHCSATPVHLNISS
jgi:hypothetical protein